jgi:hypothetical protein
MTLTTAVVTRLRTEAATAALLGSRIYPLVLPQAPMLPALAYTRISQGEQFTSNGPSGLRRVRIQLDCYAETYDAARALADAVRNALNGWRDLSLGVQVAKLAPDSEQDLHEDEVGSYRVTMDFLVHGEE